MLTNLLTGEFFSEFSSIFPSFSFWISREENEVKFFLYLARFVDGLKALAFERSDGREI